MMNQNRPEQYRCNCCGRRSAPSMIKVDKKRGIYQCPFCLKKGVYFIREF